MKIAVMGVGGVGGYLGGKLAAAYAEKGSYEVFFIARGDHLRVIEEKGLRLVTPVGEYRVKPSLATDRPADLGRLDLIVFTVKGYSLEKAADALAHSVGAETVVLPLLNGVDIVDRLKGRLPGGILLDGTIYISSVLEGPGVVRQVSPSAQLVFGPRDGNTEPLRYLEELFRGAGINTELTGRPLEAIWTKYIFICPAAGLTSLLKKSFGEILADPDDRDFLRGLIVETESIARAKGINLPSGIVEETMEKFERFPAATRTSMQLDYERGGETEIEVMSGYIVRMGRELKIQTPLHERVYKALRK